MSLAAECYLSERQSENLVVQKNEKVESKISLVGDRSGEHKKSQNPGADYLLVARTLEGDKRAFDLLVMKYQSRIARVVSIYIQDSEAVKDVVQESFIRAYKALHSYRRESQFYTWLYRIAVNTSFAHLKSNKSWLTKVTPLEDDYQEKVAPKSFEPESSSHNENLKAAIKEAVSQLPLELRTVLMLREKEGLNYEQIAQVVGCELGTVKSRMFRARDRISASIDEVLKTKD